MSAGRAWLTGRTIPARKAVAAAMLQALAGCGQSPAPRVAEPSVPVAASAAPTSPSAARWRPVALPTRHGPRGWSAATPEGFVWHDESGARWFAPRGERPQPRVASKVDLTPLAGRGYAPSLGLLAFTTDERVLAAQPPDAAYRVVARLPAGSVATTFRAFRKGLAVRGAKGLLASTDGTTFERVPGLAGYVALELMMDEQGEGVGLFAPETVAVTRDRGATWTPVPTSGVAAQTLEESREGVLLRPGGVRDGFARQLDARTGALERSAVPALHAEHALSEAERSLGWRDPFERHRLPLATEAFSSHRWGGTPRPATEGDRALVVGHDNFASERRLRALDVKFPSDSAARTPVHGGQLGEGFAPPKGEHGSSAECPHPSSAALCGGVAAIACGLRIEVFREGLPPVTFPAEPGTAIAFDKQGRLLSVAHVRGAKGDSLALRFYRFEGDERTPEERMLPVLPGMQHTGAALVGGCHRPALWLISPSHAARWEGEGFGPALPLGDAPHVVGVNHEGELVHAGATLRFSPSGKTEPFSLHPTFTDFSEDGRRALTMRGPHDLLQSLDGGHVWTPIASPDLPQLEPIVCGATRCQVGAGVFLEGDGPAPPRDAPWPGAPASHPPPKPITEEAPVVMTCVSSPGSSAKIPRFARGFSPGMGSTLAHGEARETEEDAGGTPRSPAWKVVSTAGVASDAAAEHGSAWTFEASTVAGQSRRGSLWITTTRTRSDTPSLGWLEIQPRRQADTTRFELAPGASIVDTDRRLPSFAAAEIDEDLLVLGQVDPGGIAPTRTLVARPRGALETGVGLSHTATGERTIWLLDRTDEGVAEIRRHPLSPDLAVGPGKAVPGTGAPPPGQLLDLASCAPDAAGTVVRTHVRRPVAVSIDASPMTGWLQRILRISPTTACVERTFLTTTEGALVARFVAAGNGGTAISSEQAGALRCDPLTAAGLRR